MLARNAHGFGVQSVDISEGRCPDGEATWMSLAAPTPGTSNGPCVGCSLGTPDRIIDLKLGKTGDDIAFSWTLDIKAEGGFSLYETSDRTAVSELRRQNSYLPVLLAAAGDSGDSAGSRGRPRYGPCSIRRNGR